MAEGLRGCWLTSAGQEQGSWLDILPRMNKVIFICVPVWNLAFKNTSLLQRAEGREMRIKEETGGQ